MGGTSGTLMLNEDQDFEIYQQISKLYEAEYLPKIKAGELSEKDAYIAMKARHRELILAKGGLVAESKDSDDRTEPWDKGHKKVFQVGDVVKVTEFDQEREGVVLEMIGADRVVVDFGDSFDEFDVQDCKLMVKGEDFELGDKVQFNDSGMFFLGNVQKINEDKTYDILMVGDDPDDVERGVRGESLRKVMTGRSVATARFRKASLAVIASTKMWKQVKLGGSEAAIVEGEEEVSPRPGDKQGGDEENKAL